MSFQFENKQAYLMVNDQKKSLPVDLLLEICQTILTNISPDRDYKSITSLTKLIKMINIELMNDESDEETFKNDPKEEESKQPLGKGQKKPVEESDKEDEEVEEEKPKPPVRGPVPKKPVKNSVKEMKDDDEEDD